MHSIRRLHPFVLLGFACASPGCYDPQTVDPVEHAGPDSPADDPNADPDEPDDEDECVPAGDPCAAASECCGYVGNGNSGDALCSGYDSDYRCTNVCRSDDDCAEGCCIALTGNSDYGSCAACGGVPFGSETALCLEGVTLMCDCVAGTDAECSQADRDSFASWCSDPTSADAEVFTCAGAATSCAELADMCIPDQ